MNKDINNIFFELIRVAIGNAVCLSHTPTDESVVFDGATGVDDNVLIMKQI